MNTEEIIRHYKTLLPCEQFAVTGSYALKRLGLTDEYGDIDIILVNPTDEAKSILDRLQHDFPAKTKPSETGDSNLSVIFMHGQVKIDVFIEKTKIETLSAEGFEVSVAGRIFAAKKRAKRVKDWRQLLKISRDIIADEAVQATARI